MLRIVNNRICYATHNVVCDPELYKGDPIGQTNYLTDMAEALSPEGKPSTHKQELEDMNNDGTWTIEMPKVKIDNFWSSEKAELRGELPTRMLVTVTLFNGNYDKVVCVAHCDRSQGFLPLYGAMHQRGLNIGQQARREAETEYFKRYDAYVAAHS